MWMVPASQVQTTALQGVSARARGLLRQALREHSSPRGIGHSVAVGIFAGCTPVGLHAVVALVLATALRANRLWAFLASRVSILPVYLVIAFGEIEAGHFVRTGEVLHLSASEAFARRYQVLSEWLIGTLLVGSALAATAGVLAYMCARTWHRRRRRRADDQVTRASTPVSSRTPDELRPPSSESLTSAPLDPRV
jgi:uncharacterized protein (DUF2062 family)